MKTDTLNLARISQETFIDRVHYFDQIESTNSAALAHAADSTEPLTELFIAQQQTGGRGRGGNQWWSTEGALTWSVLMRPIDTPVEHLPQVSLTMGLAICEAVEQFVQADVALKWPNDVFVDGRKVAGILIELAPGQPKRLVLGVGLNVNNSMQEAPAELRTTATSLVYVVGEQGSYFDRTAVLIACLLNIDRQLARFEARDASLADDWRGRSLLTGRHLRLVTPRSEIAGLCEGLADDGALLVRTAGGVQACHGGVVAEFH